MYKNPTQPCIDIRPGGELQLVEVQPDMPGGSMVGLHVALLEFVLKVHPDRMEFVDNVMVRTHKAGGDRVLGF